MAFKDEHHKNVYQKNIFHLLAGERSTSEVARKNNIKVSTVGMWLTNKRRNLGGREPAKQLALMVLRGEINPNQAVSQDVKVQLLVDSVAAIECNLPSINHSFEPTDTSRLEKSVSVATKKIMLKAEGLAERGIVRLAKQDCTGKLLQAQRDITPKELRLLVETAEGCIRIQRKLELIHQQRDERTKLLNAKEQQLRESEFLLSQKADRLENISEMLTSKQEEFHQYQARLSAWSQQLDAHSEKLRAEEAQAKEQRERENARLQEKENAITARQEELETRFRGMTSLYGSPSGNNTKLASKKPGSQVNDPFQGRVKHRWG